MVPTDLEIAASIICKSGRLYHFSRDEYPSTEVSLCTSAFLFNVPKSEPHVPKSEQNDASCFRWFPEAEQSFWIHGIIEDGVQQCLQLVSFSRLQTLRLRSCMSDVKFGLALRKKGGCSKGSFSTGKSSTLPWSKPFATQTSTVTIPCV
jgi:hypothetical protein